MRVVSALVFLVVASACGDNGGSSGDDTNMPDEPCEPPTSELPASGMFVDPYAAELPATCVEHGLRDLPGRWFVSDPGAYFRFEYPKYEGSCETGFHRLGDEEDHDASDGVTYHAWSDGTRYFERSSFEFGETIFISTYTACVLPDGTLAAAYLSYDNERGERPYAATGTRFTAKDEVASGLTLVGELGLVGDRRLNGLNVVVDGERAYLAGFGGLEIIDVSDPAAPTSLGFYEGSWNDVRVVNDGTNIVAFLAPYRGEDTHVVNVTDPTNPTLVNTLEYSHSINVRERNGKKELYLATYNESVPRFDVTAPLTPVLEGRSIVPGEVSGVHDLFVSEDRIFANNTTQGLVVFDVSGGITNEVELGRFRLAYSHASWAGMVGGRQIILTGDEGMGTPVGGAHLSILDGDPQSPTFMQELAKYQSRPEVGIHNFEVHGDRAYIAYYHDGVRIVDLSDPTQPREVAHYNTWLEDTAYGGSFEGAVGIRKAGDLVYVADLSRGLMIFREQ